MNKTNSFGKDYSDYTAKDFLADEDFVRWAKEGKENKILDLYWEKVMENNPAKANEINKAKELIRILSSQKVYSDYLGKEKIWRLIQARTDDSKSMQYLNLTKQLLVRYRSFAAVLLATILMAGAGWTGFRIKSEMIKPDENLFTTIYSPAGQRTEVTLPDKSKVLLNSKTTLRYSSAFNVTNRDIYLTGEAFFDVAKKSIPFEVKTAAINIKVLGTAFNVKCYDDEDVVEATLVRGSMKIEKINKSTGLREEILLKPNQKIQFLRDISVSGETMADEETESGTQTVREAEKVPLQQITQVDLISSYDTEKSTGWKEGLIIVDGESLCDLSKKIERRYDVRIVFRDEDLKKYKYSGTLREYSLEQVLNALKLTSPISYIVDKQIVYIDKNEETNSDFMKTTYK
jgi:transmembrane sensor